MALRRIGVVILVASAACSSDVEQGRSSGGGGVTISGSQGTGPASGPQATSQGSSAQGSGAGHEGGGGASASTGAGAGGAGGEGAAGVCPSGAECPTDRCVDLCGTSIAIGPGLSGGDGAVRVLPRRYVGARAGDFVIRGEGSDAVLRDPATGALVGTIENVGANGPTIAAGSLLVGQASDEGYHWTALYDAGDPSDPRPAATWYAVEEDAAALRIAGAWNDLLVATWSGMVALIDAADPNDPFAVSCFPIGDWHPGDTSFIGISADNLVVQTFNEATYLHQLSSDDPEAAVARIDQTDVEELPIIDGARLMVPDGFRHVSLYEVHPGAAPTLLAARELEAPVDYESTNFGGFAAVHEDDEGTVTWLDLRGSLERYQGPTYWAETGPCILPLTPLDGGEPAFLQPWWDPTQRYDEGSIDMGCTSSLDPAPNTWVVIPTPDPSFALVLTGQGDVAFDLDELTTTPLDLPGVTGMVAAWLAADDTMPSGSLVRVEAVSGDWFESRYAVVDLESGEETVSSTFGGVVATVPTTQALWALADQDPTDYFDPIETPRRLLRVGSSGPEVISLPDGAAHDRLAVFGDRVYAIDATADRVDVFDGAGVALRSVAWPGLDFVASLAAGPTGLLARGEDGRLGLLPPDAGAVVLGEACEQVLPMTSFGSSFLAMRRAPQGSAFSASWAVEVVTTEASGGSLVVESVSSVSVRYPLEAVTVADHAILLPSMSVFDIPPAEPAR